MAVICRSFCALIYLMFVMQMSIPSVSSAQDMTSATDMDLEFKKNKEGPQSKKLLFIVRNDTRNILYGNKCFLDVQHSMGFEYIIQPKGQPLNRNEVGRNFHNFAIKFVLLFRNGPFYGIKLKKKKRECRMSTSDFVG